MYIHNGHAGRCCSQLTRHKKSKLACLQGCAVAASVICSRQITQGFRWTSLLLDWLSATPSRVLRRISCCKPTSCAIANTHFMMFRDDFYRMSSAGDIDESAPRGRSRDQCRGSLEISKLPNRGILLVTNVDRLQRGRNRRRETATARIVARCDIPTPNLCCAVPCDAEICSSCCCCSIHKVPQDGDSDGGRALAQRGPKIHIYNHGAQAMVMPKCRRTTWWELVQSKP